MHLNLRVPDELDALCLQLTSGAKSLFSRRYAMGADRVGKAQTLTVLPGQEYGTDFEVLLRGERAGRQVSWLREKIAFASNSVERRDLDVGPTQPTDGGASRCSGVLGSGRFRLAGRLHDKQGAVAPIPVPFAPTELVVPSVEGSVRLAYSLANRRIERHPEGLPVLGAAGALHRVLVFDLHAAGEGGECHLDILLLRGSGPLIWRHRGDGTFDAAPAPITGKEYSAAAAADLNGDGRVDLALVSPTEGLAVLLNRGGGSFEELSLGLAAGTLSEPTSVAAGFFDGDGAPDLVLGQGTVGKKPVLLLSDGKPNPTFRAVTLSAAPERPTPSVAAADFNRDGLTDLVLGQDDATVVLVKNGRTNAFERHDTFGIPDAKDILAQDLNADCAPDLVLARPRPGGARILINDGTGRFAESLVELEGGPGDPPGGTNVAAADVDGDGVIDVLLGGEPQGAFWLQQKPR
ncbi:MAG: VCBS repeat-containing protein [Deltaproteobacteria bacterium]|nr:VCBS repeat-containing protein [Deltaproteobacteria bacterium]